MSYQAQGKGEVKGGDSSYGNSGLEMGPGASAQALAFLELCKLADSQQKIVEARAELAKASVEGAEAVVVDQNAHYTNEMRDQMLSDYADAASAGSNAVVSGISAGIQIKMSSSTSESSIASQNAAKMSTLKDNFATAQPHDGAAMGEADGAPQPSDPCLQHLQAGNYKGAAQCSDADQTAAIARLTPAERAQKSQDVNAEYNRALQIQNSAMLGFSTKQSYLNTFTQILQGVVGAVVGGYKGTLKGGAGWGGESQAEAHNQQTIDQLKQQLMMNVMSDQAQNQQKSSDVEIQMWTNYFQAMVQASRV